MMRLPLALSFGVLVFAATSPAMAQTWTGGYLGGVAGSGHQAADASEVVRFDTNLDGVFMDTVRTAAGADAFSPGFCGGLAVNAMAASGCTDDKNGFAFSGRVGYDRQVGRIVIGGLFDVSKLDIDDSVTAFSTTPAFYSFTRTLTYVAGVRARVGVSLGRALIYGTGGTAWGQVDQTFTTSNAVNTFTPGPGTSQGTNASGYQGGGGVEIRLASRLSLVGEYVFTNLDTGEDSTVRSQGPAPATNAFILVNTAGTELQRTEAFEFQAVHVGVHYRF